MSRQNRTEPEPVQPQPEVVAISEGVRLDLVAYGWAVDPVTGYRLKLDDEGRPVRA